MGFRNPATSATAVDTRAGTATPGVQVYNRTQPWGSQGVVEFDDGIPGDTAATITAGPNYQQQGGGYAPAGGSMTMQAGTWSGVAGPAFQANVEAAPAGGYTPVARVKGAPLVVDGPITGAAPTDAAQLTLNSGAFTKYSGRGAGCYIDAAGDVQLDGLLNNVGAVALGQLGLIVGNVPAGYAPAQNKWFAVPIYPSSLALVGVRAAGTIIVDALFGSALAAGAGAWDISVITYNPTSTS